MVPCVLLEVRDIQLQSVFACVPEQFVRCIGALEGLEHSLRHFHLKTKSYTQTPSQSFHQNAFVTCLLLGIHAILGREGVKSCALC